MIWVVLPMILVSSFLLIGIPFMAWRDVGWLGSALLACLSWPAAVVFLWGWLEVRKFEKRWPVDK